MTELQILRIVNSNKSIDYTDLRNQICSDLGMDAVTATAEVKYLLSSNILSGKPETYSPIGLTDRGLCRLHFLEYENKQAQDQAAKEAKEKRSQKRHAWALAIFSAFSGALVSDPLWKGIRALVFLLKSLFV